MTASITRGARVPTIRWATAALELTRAARSAGERWAKNSMGRWSTFQRNRALDDTASLPVALRRRRS